MVSVDAGSFLTIVVVAMLAALLAGLLARRLVVPVVVLELLLGIVVGPEVLDLAHPDEFVDFFSNLGLGMLFFFAGYEIDFERIRGEPLRLAAFGWAISLVLAYARRRAARARRDRAVAAVHRLGDRDDCDRHADPDPARRRRAAERASARTCSAPARWASSARSC